MLCYDIFFVFQSSYMHNLRPGQIYTLMVVWFVRHSLYQTMYVFWLHVSHSGQAALQGPLLRSGWQMDTSPGHTGNAAFINFLYNYPITGTSWILMTVDGPRLPHTESHQVVFQKKGYLLRTTEMQTDMYTVEDGSVRIYSHYMIICIIWLYI